MKIEVSVGEVIDKYTILDIKQSKITDDVKGINIATEKNHLALGLEEFGYLKEFENEIRELKQINECLWNIEDKIRIKEANLEFDEEFIELARSVYMTNDRRFEVKRRINELSNSRFKEEKSYAKYD